MWTGEQEILSVTEPSPPNPRILFIGGVTMLKLLLFCILLLVCWPLALATLLLYPLICLILLPFRLVGIVVGGVFELIAALFSLPARALRSI
jgi:hypothetical protein